MRILTFTTLFPNQGQPRHGLFVEHRLRQLVSRCPVTAVVVAPVPWFPFKNEAFGEYARFARAPKTAEKFGVRVYHPRFPVIPKVGMTIAPYLLSRWTQSILSQLRNDFKYDLIDAHYLYPDGVAATMIGERLGIPVVITARGSDVNLISEYPVPRRQILRSIDQAAAVVTVSRALKDKLVQIGAPEEKITVLPNGVDLDLFRPFSDTNKPTEKLSLLSVGNLVENKGHHIAVEALRELPDVELRIAGAGPQLSQLQQLAEDFGVENRIKFLGSIDQTALVEEYNRSDCLVLLSENEGMPNVVLEAMACGMPVIATRAGGIPEVVTPEVGVLLKERRAATLVAAVKGCQSQRPPRDVVRKHAEGFSWQATSDGQLALFRQAVGV